MATIEVQDLLVAGLDEVEWTAASPTGDEVPTGNRVLLLVRNGDASPHTLTVVTPGTVRGVPIEDPTVAVPDGEIAAVPLVNLYRDPSTRRAAISMDDETSVEYAAVRLPR